MFYKKGVLKNFLCQSLFCNKEEKKETLAHVFSCEFCEIFKNIVFYRTPLMAASDYRELCVIFYTTMKAPELLGYGFLMVQK